MVEQRIEASLVVGSSPILGKGNNGVFITIINNNTKENGSFISGPPFI